MSDEPDDEPGRPMLVLATPVGGFALQLAPVCGNVRAIANRHSSVRIEREHAIARPISAAGAAGAP